MNKSSAILTAVACSGAFASTALAGSIFASTTIGGGIFSPSSKVGIELVSTATSYAATSAHLNGTFEYGTVGGINVTGDPTKISSKSFTTTGSTSIGVPDAPTASDSLPGSGWQ